MIIYGMCSACKSTISQERLGSKTIICNHCGHSNSEAQQKFRKETAKISTLVMLGFSIILVGAFIHNSIWGSHSLEIIPHKALLTVGLGDESNYNKVQEICLKLKMVDCVQESLEDQLASDSTHLATLKKLGKLHYQRKNYDEAHDIFTIYFSHRGNDLKTAYYFAKTLAQLGNLENAAQYFDFILASKPDVLQITVTEAYMNMLIEANMYKAANKLAESVQLRTQHFSMTLLAQFKIAREGLRTSNN